MVIKHSRNYGAVVETEETESTPAQVRLTLDLPKGELDDQTALVTHLTNVMTIELGKRMAIPMDMIDGRPWVPTEEELHYE